MKAEEIATKAASLVSGDREKMHGNKATNFDNIACLWNAWLSLRGHTVLTGADVAKLMALLKIARMESGEFNDDDFVDAVGYVSCAGELSAPSKSASVWEDTTLMLYCPHGISKHDLCTVCEARIASLGSEIPLTRGVGQ